MGETDNLRVLDGGHSEAERVRAEQDSLEALQRLLDCLSPYDAWHRPLCQRPARRSPSRNQ